MRGQIQSIAFQILFTISVGWMTAVAAGSQAHSEENASASKEKLYLEEAAIRSPEDPTFARYWGDEAKIMGWTASDLPGRVVRVRHFTDADGRNLVVTTINAFPLCGINGCPVRIQTEQGEKLMDRWACDLPEDHHLSADGRTFIACDEEFPIPKGMAGSAQTAAYASKSPPRGYLYSEERDIKGPEDPAFAAYWSDEVKNIDWKAAPPLRSISVGHFTDADGRGLVATTIYDRYECGIQYCPLRIFTEQGAMIVDLIACNATEFHRIAPNRRYLIACGQAIQIPGAISPTAETKNGAGPISVRTSQPQVEMIPYDSGSELEGRKTYVFQAYWNDKSSQIDWKLPASKRGMIYNSSLPSADGRRLFLTMLESSSGSVCDPLCPVRVFTDQHKKIMDIRICSDRTQHGVSVDHRSLIACGETFSIPQVDDRTAIMENAPSDSNAEAYVEVVRRQRSRPANMPAPILVDSAYHNKSEMLVSEWKDGTVEIAYNHPRSGLPVAQGTILFRGIKDGIHYSGTAFTFKEGCPPAPYAVTGVRETKKDQIVMTGAAPRRSFHSCDVIGELTQSRQAKLVFDTRFYGDE